MTMIKWKKSGLPKYSIIGTGLLSFLLSILSNVSSTFAFLNGKESSLILGLITLIAIDQFAQRNSIFEVRDDVMSKIKDMNDINNKRSEAFQNQKAGIVTEIEDSRVFEDFVGEEYYAYNAPLQYEAANIDSRLRFHIERYKNQDFRRAYYYYPIFAHPDRTTARNWMRGVGQFYDRLRGTGLLTIEELDKIRFYVPNSQYRFDSKSDITYFTGIRRSGEKAIIYIHNDIFMNLSTRNPKAMLIVYDQAMIQLLRDHRMDTTTNMSELDITGFLNYLGSWGR
jgi:hypothetical protein